MNLKDDDRVINVDYSNLSEVFVATKNGYGLWYNTDEVSIVGIRASGVKSINLKSDEVVSSYLFNPSEEYITVITDKGTGKRLKLTEIDKTTRGNRGLLLMKEIKSNPSKIVSTYIMNGKNEIIISTDRENKQLKLTEIPIMDRASNGSYVVKDKANYSYKVVNLTSKDDYAIEESNVVIPSSKMSLKEVDESIASINDILKKY